MTPGERAPPSPAGAKRRPLTIPGFEVEAEVGRGGMGIVYRARQTSIDRKVAVKILPTAAAKDPSFVDKFLKEAKAAAKLNHENVVSAIDAGRAGDVVYFVMEYIDGETVRERLDRDGPLPLDLALRTLRDAAKALVHAEHHGLVHRDVKPDNIMLNADGRALLCDLGLARMTATEGEKGKRTGVAEGTPYYIAPEQAKGYADIDIRADIYALGMTAYHMLTGEYAFDGADAREIMLKQVNEPFPDLGAGREGLPPALVELIGRMVEKDREKRPRSPAEVVAAVERIMSDTGAGPALAASQSPAALALAAGVVVLAAILVVALGSRPSPDPAPGAPEQVAAGPTSAQNFPVSHASVPSATLTAQEVVSGVSSAGADGAREAEAALKLASLTDALKAEAPAHAEALRRYRELAAAYPGTKAARRCEEEAAVLERRTAERRAADLGRKLRDIDAAAADLVAAGRFATAAEQYEALLESEKGGPGEERIRKSVHNIEAASSGALDKLKPEIAALVTENEPEKAVKVLEDFAARAAGPSVEVAKKWAEKLATASAAAAVAREAGAAERAAFEHLRSGAYDEARKVLDEAMKSPRLAGARLALDALGRARALVDAAAEAAKAIDKGLYARAIPDKVSFGLLAGDPPAAGRGLGYDFKESRLLKVAEGPKSEPVTELRLADLDPTVARTVSELRQTDSMAASPLTLVGHGIVLLYRGALAAGLAELRAAEAAGERLPAALASDLKRAESSLADALAEAVHRRGASLFALERFGPSLAHLGRLVLGGDLAGTAYARTFAKEIGGLWVQVRAVELMSGPLQAFFAGKVESKGLKFKLAYDFNDPGQVGDFSAARFEPFKDGFARHMGGGLMRVKGRATWRGKLRGEATIDAGILGGGPNVNANFVIYDRIEAADGGTWYGWLCGIGTRLPGLDIFRLSPRSPQKGAAFFQYPAHLIAYFRVARGADPRADFMFAARGPNMPPAGFRLAVQAKRRVLNLFAQGKLIGSSPFPEEDMQGGIAIQPYDRELDLDELKIAGEIDEDWLRAEALARAQAELAAGPKK